MTTKVMTSRIPLSLAKKVDQLAARLERSRAWIIEQALSAWVDNEEESQPTRKAMADVDAGHVIDHKDVQDWAESPRDENPLTPDILEKLRELKAERHSTGQTKKEAQSSYSSMTVMKRCKEVFESTESANAWLKSEVIALGGRTPLSLLKSARGRALVLKELGRMEHGIVS